MALAAAAALAAGCTSSSHGEPSVTSTGASAECTTSTAQAAARTILTAKGFNPSCVTIKAGSVFSILNESRRAREVVTQPGAPSSFVADLPHKNSTFAHRYKKRGTYPIIDQTTGKTMTLYVT